MSEHQIYEKDGTLMGSKWKNRIVGHAEVDPKTLVPNPDNWRLHPKGQKDAMEGALDEIGWVQEITVNQNTGLVVDGHQIGRAHV